MKASIHVEPGVNEAAIGAAVCATDILGSNLPPSLGGLEADVVRLDHHFPSIPGHNQVDASFIECGDLPAWADESLNVFVTNRPLRLGRAVLHGYARIGDGIAIASAARLDRNNPHVPLELLAVTLHESGHAFGLVNEGARQYNRATDHCGNLCIMESGAEREPIDVAKLALGERGIQGGFCQDCRDDLSRLSIVP
jgi:hypothetical protein